MANDSNTQTALANDQNFRKRVGHAFSSVAWQVTTEDPATANHAARVAYAKQVIRNLQGELSIILPSFVVRPNVINFPTTYEFDWVQASGYVACGAADADLESQLFSDWDAMAAGAGYGANPAVMGSIPPPPLPPAR